jgi:hypothetical protein
MRKGALLAVLMTAAAGCTGAGSGVPTTGAALPRDDGAATVLLDSAGTPIPPAPDVPRGPLDTGLAADLDVMLGDIGTSVDVEAIERIGDSGDPRAAWLLADLLRFAQRGHVADTAAAAFERLTGTDVTAPLPWQQVTDRLIAWDLPAPPGYVDWKRRLFEFVEPAWERFFDDPDADIDWRWVSWGGVLIDDRPLDAAHRPCPEGCIPALDEPAVTNADEGGWYDDDDLVFGVVVDGAARAYPRNIMEVHEMVNDTLAGRRIGIAYCTLCGSAQAYLTDGVPPGFDTVELRTSGLLSRSNKVMFDLHTWSVFDTFTGRAQSGPLQGLTLEMITVATSTWGAWKAAHPDTTIVAQDGGIGRDYPDDPLRGRDDDGPIFPIGDVDPRLPVQEQVLGVIAPDGGAVAFPVDEATRALDDDEEVTAGDVRVVSDGAGLQAETLGGVPIPAHQAFWFAWSQFHPDTDVWTSISLRG